MAFICGHCRNQFESSDVRHFAIAAVPVVYGVLFASVATRSPLVWGDAMLYRQSYVTPIGMIAIGLLLISLKLSAISANRWLAYLQVAVLILPLAIYVRPLNKAFGFRKTHFVAMQRNMLEELDRRITWFHCIGLEGQLASGQTSNCFDSRRFEAHGSIRRRARPPCACSQMRSLVKSQRLKRPSNWTLAAPISGSVFIWCEWRPQDKRLLSLARKGQSPELATISWSFNPMAQSASGWCKAPSSAACGAPIRGDCASPHGPPIP